MKLEEFKIIRLHGEENIVLEVEENTLIIVAENGTGKTTILRIVYLFLSKQWAKLVDFQFDKIEATIDGKDFVFKRESYLDSKYSIDQFTRIAKKYTVYSSFIEEILSKYDIDELLRNPYLLNEIEREYDVPFSLVSSLVNDLSESHFNDSQYDWKSSIIYLPTYRRIEKDFDSLFGDLNQRLENYIRSILPEPVEKESVDFDELENDLKNVFSDLWTARDQEKWKKTSKENAHIEMVEFGMEDVKDKIRKVLKVIEDGNKELIENLKSFIETVDKYLTNGKSMVVHGLERKVSVKSSDGSRSIELDNLSSGEKQILSIFCLLYFSATKPFLIIDEPELSLSISWQETLLLDLKKAEVQGMLIATHSPFIVSDEFVSKTKGTNEFVR